MTAKTIELMPNRQLIDPDFDGYKLSLNNTPIIKKKLDVPVSKVLADPNNYSYLRAKLIGLYNHLIGEHVGGVSFVYFIDEIGKIQKITNNSESEIDIVNVFTIPKHRNKTFSDYDASLKFASGSLAVSSDGMGKLFILQTCDRSQQANYWKCLFNETILENGACFMIQDARFRQCNAKNEIHCLLYTIEKIQNEKFASILYWVILTEGSKSGTWKKNQIKRISSNSNNEIIYAYMEISCEALYLISDGCFQFEHDMSEIQRMQLNEAPTKEYSWNQTSEDITCQVTIPDNTNMDCVLVNTEETNISIIINGKYILKGELVDKINSNLTSWSIDNDKLLVTMSKQHDGKMWNSLIINDNETPNKLNCLQCEKDLEPPLGTTFNSEQVEECDFEDDKYTTFERISNSSNEVTHKINVNTHTLILTVTTNESLVPALALRHDVDALIWQPEMDDGNNFSFVHRATLNALGYVQASKTQRKYSVCAYDMSYCAICDASRRVFIYRQRVTSSGELRNRTTGKRIQHTAQQQVIDLGNDDEILGIYPATDKLFLLTSKDVFVLKL